MKDVADRLPEIERNIMSGLKDFQQATVNRIDALYHTGQMRVLVSDEVGLGKTLIARGAVAKVARRLHEENNAKLVKVVYICSNAAIADQNLEKLRITQEVRKESAGYSRLSMQHLNIFMQERDVELKKSYIQLIPLTPNTSFHLTSGNGLVDERALMYAILRRVPVLKPYRNTLEALMKGKAPVDWERWAKDYYETRVIECNKLSKKTYLPYMIAAAERELCEEIEPGYTLESAVIDICKRIKKNKMQYIGSGNVVRKLRTMFAKISLDKLEPDLVIMDEFQRFKDLLHAEVESETAMLTERFFKSDSVRMLLLSATPYKMYSTLDEIDETNNDEHFAEFLDVMKFLTITEDAYTQFNTVWRNYSVQLKEFSQGTTSVLSAKQVAEDAMYTYISRTERMTEKNIADLIDDSDLDEMLEITEADIRSYLEVEKVLDVIEASYHAPIDYVKSTPYLMSFMNHYQLKKNVEMYFEKHPEEINKIKSSLLWLERSKIDKYAEIPTNNARLKHVMDYAFLQNAEKLLWVPPSKPYYAFQGVYRNADEFSKMLIFSSWEMVPRMLATMISYEAERRSIGSIAKANKDREAHYFSGENNTKRYPSARLNFTVNKEKKPNAMTLFCLMYPSLFLTQCYNPVDCMNRGLSLKAIESEVKTKISEQLSKYPSPQTGQPDKRWYYLAPLFLDDDKYVTKWLDEDKALAVYEDVDEKERKQDSFLMHLATLKSLYYEMDCGNNITLGKRPNDLLNVLTDMAIASPAICINRTYGNYVGSQRNFANCLPSQIAKLFINRMNTVEFTATVELACGRKSEDAHWQNVLTYCKQGNLQAMFDEYAHLLINGMDNDEELIKKLHNAMAESMDFRTTVYEIDTYQAFNARMNGKKENKPRIRTHFAVAFTKGDGKEKDTDRKKSVRNAFNSPFRPFVLASTSIGQEGLDFHNYCRRIVHWNLPSNPIDLEQREGRINRFECLAIRQNVAKRYGGIAFQKNIWEELFEEAKRIEKTTGSSDLIPYWGLKETEDMIKIERIVPMYPFSQDELAYERLIKILSLYRLTLGQSRQEELLEYIFQNCEEPEKLRSMFINLSPFYREKEVL